LEVGGWCIYVGHVGSRWLVRYIISLYNTHIYTQANNANIYPHKKPRSKYIYIYLQLFFSFVVVDYDNECLSSKVCAGAPKRLFLNV
jgi:hypothetical protein